jgi:hypothetical protein
MSQDKENSGHTHCLQTLQWPQNVLLYSSMKKSQTEPYHHQIPISPATQSILIETLKQLNKENYSKVACDRAILSLPETRLYAFQRFRWFSVPLRCVYINLSEILHQTASQKHPSGWPNTNNDTN